MLSQSGLTVLQRLAREMLVWVNVNHPNIIQVHGYHLSPDLEDAYLISSFAPYGRIDHYVVNEQASAFEKLKLVSLLPQPAMDRFTQPFTRFWMPRKA